MTTVATAIFSCLLMPVGRGPIAVPRWRIPVGRAPVEEGADASIYAPDLNGVTIEAHADAKGVKSVTIIDKETGDKQTGASAAEVYKPADASGAQQGLRVYCELKPAGN